MRLPSLAIVVALCPLAIAAPSPLHHRPPPPPPPPPPSSPPPSPLSRWASLPRAILHAVVALKLVALPNHSVVTQPPPHALARYGGDLVLRFNISTAEESGSVAQAADTLMLDVWGFAHDWVDIRLSKHSVPLLLGLLPDSLQHAHRPLLSEKELSDAVLASYPRAAAAAAAGDQTVDIPPRHAAAAAAAALVPWPPRRPFSAHQEQTTGAETNLFFADYQPLSVMEPWLRLLASLFTTHVRPVHIGLSYEGRQIPAVRVGVHPTYDRDHPTPSRRKTILVVGSLHAREWISASTVNYIAYALITGYGREHDVTDMLEQFDFVFIPTLNPDGYTYTWETDRLWRKNRQQTGIRFCQGMDLDRSFGYEWSATDNPCSESYTGEAPFQAVEAQRLAAWAKNETENNNVDFVGFLDLHSYSQQVLYPYSYSCDDAPPGLENLQELAMGLVKSIRTTHGRNYEVMSACEGNSVVTAADNDDDDHHHHLHLRPSIEATGGSALDFFYRTVGVKYAYQIKLRDRGTYGFLLPKEHIVPTGTEILNAVLYFTSFLGDLYDSSSEEQTSISRNSSSPAPDETGKGTTDDADDGARMTHAPLAPGADDGEEEAHEQHAWVVGPADAKYDLKRRRRK